VTSERSPFGTYGLQLHGGFTFKDAQALVDYFYDLGISDVAEEVFARIPVAVLKIPPTVLSAADGQSQGPSGNK
jgi:hypothetical protein